MGGVETAIDWMAARLAPYGLADHAGLVLALGLGVAAVLLGLMLRVMFASRPRGARLSESASDPISVAAERRRPAPEGATLVVAVSKFGDDAGELAHRNAIAALEQAFAASGCVVTSAPAPGRGTIDRLAPRALAEADLAAISRAAKLGADVAVWGQRLGDDGVRLRFRPVSAGGAAWARAAEETLSLPALDSPAAAVAFAAATAAAAAPEESRRAAFVSGPLAAASRLVAAVQAEPETLAKLGALDRCRTQEAFARLDLRRFAEVGDADALDRALEAANGAVVDGRRPTAPQEWAAAQAVRGLCWAVRAARDDDRAALAEAAAAFSKALSVADAARTPLARARLSSDLGEARLALAAHDPGLADAEEAAVAFEAAAEVFDRHRLGVDAAAARFGLARALAVLGEREAGARRLVEAVGAFDAALAGLDADEDPEGWSDVQIARARCLTTLGRRERGVERLEAAAAGFRAALARRDRRTDRAGWALAQAGLGAALEALGERERGAERLNEAVSTLLGALRAAEEAGQETLAKAVRRDLTRAERLLAERRASRVEA